MSLPLTGRFTVAYDDEDEQTARAIARDLVHGKAMILSIDPRELSQENFVFLMKFLEQGCADHGRCYKVTRRDKSDGTFEIHLDPLTDSP